jgi:hypothetical protein
LVIALVINGCTTTQVNSECPKVPSSDLKISKLQNLELLPTQEKSGAVPSDRSWGYSLKILDPQILTVQPTNNLCIWISNYLYGQKLVNSSPLDLQITGDYLIQVAEQKGEPNYKIAFNLKPVPITPSPKPSPTLIKVTPTKPKEPDKFTKSDAIALIDRWLSAKSQIFAPPHNVALANQLLTGKLATDANDGIYNLKQSGSAYKYSNQKVTRVISFQSNLKQARIEVEIIETVMYYEKGNLVSNNNNVYVYVYDFEKVNSEWKISEAIERK